MRLIVLYGMPAVGKLTVAQELVNVTRYKLFHNHLVADLVQSVFPFGSPEFVELREQFWLSVFDKAARSGMSGMIFTFNPESTVRAAFIQETIKTVEQADGHVDFVELTCPLPELKRRMASLSRHQFKKLTSVELFEELHAEGVFEANYMPKPRLSIDTSEVQPARAALQIARTLALMPAE
jgi:deoxyadenosine/deoxycytidine kinase